jgi:hypothetical protein
MTMNGGTSLRAEGVIRRRALSSIISRNFPYRTELCLASPMPQSAGFSCHARRRKA